MAQLQNKNTPLISTKEGEDLSFFNAAVNIILVSKTIDHQKMQ